VEVPVTKMTQLYLSSLLLPTLFLTP